MARQCAAVVGVLTWAMKSCSVLASTVCTVFAPDDWTVTVPLELLTMVYI